LLDGLSREETMQLLRLMEKVQCGNNVLFVVADPNAKMDYTELHVGRKKIIVINVQAEQKQAG
jgi:hypothetical protein